MDGNLRAGVAETYQPANLAYKASERICLKNETKHQNQTKHKEQITTKLKSKTRWLVPEEQYSRLTSSPYMHVHICAYP